MLTEFEMMKHKADMINRASGSLGFMNCDECHNKGYVAAVEDGNITTKECACMKKRLSLQHVKESGIEYQIGVYTMEAYEPYNRDAKSIKFLAEEYTKLDFSRPTWFFISGNPGSGKTHICTAVCKAMIDRGKSVRYFKWRDDSLQLKALVTDQEAYADMIAPFKHCDVLYVDDFWKGRVTDGDINLTFDLINSRYAQGRITLFSSERNIEAITKIDEAIGSRIIERCGKYCLCAPKNNARMNPIGQKKDANSRLA